MADFSFYFQLGIEHILSWEAMDHILFVAALCLRYQWKDIKTVALLVTAFTIGHSLTLALSATNLLRLPTEWIEFLIPLTIIATALYNLAKGDARSTQQSGLIYSCVLLFGLLHGLAFANQFLALEGRDGLIFHLLAFNAGIEIAQLVVVAIVLCISMLMVRVIRLPAVWWLRTSLFIILLYSITWACERFPIHTKTKHDETIVGKCSDGDLSWWYTTAKCTTDPE